MKTGASKIYIDDLQEEFARDFIFPMMQAGAIYENQYFLGTSIARPLIAKRMVEIARAGKGRRGRARRDRERERPGAVRTDGRGAGAGAGGHRAVAGRAVSQRISRARGDDRLTASEENSRCRRPRRSRIRWTAIFCTSPSRRAFWKIRGWTRRRRRTRRCSRRLSVSPEDAPDKPEYVTLDFEKGNCVAVNGKALNPLGVMRALNKLGGKHGVGPRGPGGEPLRGDEIARRV